MHAGLLGSVTCFLQTTFAASAVLPLNSLPTHTYPHHPFAPPIHLCRQLVELHLPEYQLREAILECVDLSVGR